MRIWDLPLVWRLLAAFVFLAAASGIELLFRGRAATRWRSSLFLVACGAAGAAFGACVDLVTSSISPAYFVHGKGLEAGAGLWTRALRLGAQAGLSVGVLLGCILVLAGHSGRSRELTARPSFDRLPGMVTFALLGGVAGGLLGALVPIGQDFAVLDGLSVPLAERRSFLTVWSAHAGLYVAALAATAMAARRIWRSRMKVATNR